MPILSHYRKSSLCAGSDRMFTSEPRCQSRGFIQTFACCSCRWALLVSYCFPTARFRQKSSSRKKSWGSLQLEAALSKNPVLLQELALLLHNRELPLWLAPRLLTNGETDWTRRRLPTRTVVEVIGDHLSSFGLSAPATRWTPSILFITIQRQFSFVLR